MTMGRLARFLKQTRATSFFLGLALFFTKRTCRARPSVIVSLARSASRYAHFSSTPPLLLLRTGGEESLDQGSAGRWWRAGCTEAAGSACTEGGRRP